MAIDSTGVRRSGEGSAQEKVAPLAPSREGEFLAQCSRRLAHDLNNIVMGIYGHADLGMAAPAVSDEIRAHLQAVVQGATRASRIANHLLVLGRRALPELCLLDMRTSLATAGQLVETRLASGVEYSLALPSDPVPVFGDPNQLHGLIIALCENAIDSLASTGGRLELSLSSVHLDEGDVREACSDGWDPKPGEYAKVVVRDTGMGIHLDSLPKIFEPFYSTKGTEGIGLGLTIVRQIVLGMGGFVELQTMLSEGTTMAVFFPRGAESPG